MGIAPGRRLAALVVRRYDGIGSTPAESPSGERLAMQTRQLSPLARTIAQTPTDIWNDSCAVDELEYAIAFGAVGATANPTIVVDNWKKDPAHWSDRTRVLALEQPDWTEVDLAWAIVQEMSVRGAKLLEPAFDVHRGRQGRLS